MNSKCFSYLQNKHRTLFDIIANKIKLEHTQSHEGREMELLLSQKGISENLYIQESGIIQQYQRIEELVRSISNN